MADEERENFVPCGTESELGVTCEGEDHHQAMDRFVFDLGHKAVRISRGEVAWDPSDRILDDARLKRTGSSREEHEYFRQRLWREGGNHLLPNGARFYHDGQPEISTPLCHNPQQAIIWSRACYRWIDYLRKTYLTALGKKYHVFRNNVALRDINDPRFWLGSPKSRITFACHEDYTFTRSVPTRKLISTLSPFFILRPPVIGAGKVGADNDMPWTDFQISARADFFECLIGTQTTVARPIYNLRDTPYADETRYRRIHVINGDSNMLELPEYLKIGLTSILLMMLRDSQIDNRFELLDPIDSFWRVSRDLDFREHYAFRNRSGRKTVLDCLKEYADLFWNYLEVYQPDNEAYKNVVRLFFAVLNLLETRDREAFWGKSDWGTKWLLLNSALELKRKSWQSDLAAKLDIQYHDNDHENGLFFRKIHPDPLTVRVSTDEEVESAMLEPPPTRSRWTTETNFKFKRQIYSADFWYKTKFLSEESDLIKELRFNNPHLAWNAELANQLLSLPLSEFLEAVPNADLDATINNRKGLDFYRTRKDYDPDDYEFVQLPFPWKRL